MVLLSRILRVRPIPPPVAAFSRRPPLTLRRCVATHIPPSSSEPEDPNQKPNFRVMGGAALITAAFVLYLSSTSPGQSRMDLGSSKSAIQPTTLEALHDRMDKLEEKARHKHDHYDHASESVIEGERLVGKR